MSGPLAGVRVVELASWTFVPAAGAFLADLGAEVIKIEPPGGDPQRGLQNMLNFGTSGPNPFLEIPNRGKRSMVIDLANDAGREAFLKVVASADVFLTSYLPAVRARLRVELDDLRAVNPRLIYVRGSGWGSQGPMRDVGGYDVAAGWASSGLAHRLSPPDSQEPPALQPPAFFDLQGANTIAGAVSTALFQRERTGEPTVVDVSLLSVGWWTMAPDIVAAPFTSLAGIGADRSTAGNPITNSYRTSDGRWLYLVCLQGDRFWAEVCRTVDRPDLIDDARFSEGSARFENRRECIAELDKSFGSRTLAEWRERFAGFTGVWAPVLSPSEVLEHVQAGPNGYLPEVTMASGTTFKIPAPPVQFGEVPPTPQGPAPEAGQHTEEILLEVGLGWEQIAALHEEGALS